MRLWLIGSIFCLGLAISAAAAAGEVDSGWWRQSSPDSDSGIVFVFSRALAGEEYRLNFGDTTDKLPEIPESRYFGAMYAVKSGIYNVYDPSGQLKLTASIAQGQASYIAVSLNEEDNTLEFIELRIEEVSQLHAILAGANYPLVYQNPRTITPGDNRLRFNTDSPYPSPYDSKPGSQPRPGQNK